MDLAPMVTELGGLTTLVTLGHYRGDASGLSPIEDSLAKYLPVNPSRLNDLDNGYRVNVAESLNFVQGIQEKKKIIIAGAELLFMEAISELRLSSKVYQIVDDRLSLSSIARMRENIPEGVDGMIYPIPTVPFGLSPTGSVLLASGFWGGGSMVLIHESVRAVLLFLKNIYFGEKMLVAPYSKIVHSRPEGWVTVNYNDFFTGCTGGPMFSVQKYSEQPHFKTP